MSGILQIVGQTSGVSHLLSIDSGGRALLKDADNITQTTAINTKLTAIDAVLDNSLVQQTACATDLAAIEVLQTAGNASLSAIATDAAALEVLQTAGNASLSAIATDAAALEVLQTSTNAVLSTIETSNAAIKTAVEGTLSVSAPAISATSAVLENATSVADSATETTPSTDVGSVRRVAIFGSIDDSSGSIKVEVSADNSTFYQNTEQTIYVESDKFYKTIELDARYVRFKYTNGSGSAKTWTAILSYKA